MRRQRLALATVMCAIAGSVATPAAPASADYNTIWTGQPIVLSNPQSNQVADVAGASKESTAAVVTFPFHGKANQLWRFTFHRTINGVNYWYAVARHSGLCLDVQWGSTQPGAPVWQWSCNYGTAQLWAIDRTGSPDRFGVGTMRLRNLGSDMCLTVAGPASWQLRQHPCQSGNLDQDWQFTHPVVSIANAIVITRGALQISPAGTRRFTGDPWQNFQLLRPPGTNDVIISDGLGGCLRPTGPFYYLPGARLAPLPCGSPLEVWRARLSGYDAQGIPVTQVVNVSLGYCLEFDANEAPESATLRTWPCGSGWTQRWYIYT